MTNDLTIEQAVGELKAMKEHIELHMSVVGVTAYDMAIKALEQQPMRDATEEERKSVKDYIESVSKPTGFNFYEAQSCEDCIGRQAVLNGLANIAKAKAKSDAQKALMGRVMFFTEQLPPVTPQYTDEEIDKAQAVEQAYVDKMVELAVEEIKRPKGKWITWKEAGNYIPSETRFECSVCHDAAQTLCNGLDLLSPYCPNCGAEMGGADETN